MSREKEFTHMNSKEMERGGRQGFQPNDAPDHTLCACAGACQGAEHGCCRALRGGLQGRCPATLALLKKEPTGSAGFSFYVMEEPSGNPMSGIEFTLTQDGQPVNQVLSCERGHVWFGALPAGVYQLNQVTRPAGYIPNEASYTVTMREDGDMLVDGRPAGRFSVKNVLLAALTVRYRLGSAGRRLFPDARITLVPGPYAVADPPTPIPSGTECGRRYLHLARREDDPQSGEIAPGQSRIVTFVYELGECPEGTIFDPRQQACVLGDCDGLVASWALPDHMMWPLA